jgi:hypothetical protein
LCCLLLHLNTLAKKLQHETKSCNTRTFAKIFPYLPLGFFFEWSLWKSKSLDVRRSACLSICALKLRSSIWCRPKLIACAIWIKRNKYLVFCQQKKILTIQCQKTPSSVYGNFLQGFCFLFKLLSNLNNLLIVGPSHASFNPGPAQDMVRPCRFVRGDQLYWLCHNKKIRSSTSTSSSWTRSQTCSHRTFAHNILKTCHTSSRIAQRPVLTASRSHDFLKKSLSITSWDVLAWAKIVEQTHTQPYPHM